MKFRMTKSQAQNENTDEQIAKEPLKEQPAPVLKAQRPEENDEKGLASGADIISCMQELSRKTSGELLAECNSSSQRFGLVLTQSSLQELERQRVSLLKSTGRVEFGDGVLLKLIEVFRSSPYLDQTSYSQTLGELQEIFYSFKNECRELLTDDELIEAMRLIFDEVSRGSTEFISNIEWDTMYRIARTGSLHGTDLEYPYPGEGFADDDEQ